MRKIRNIKSLVTGVLLLAGFGASASLLVMRIYTYESGKAEYRLLRQGLGSMPGQHSAPLPPTVSEALPGSDGDTDEKKRNEGSEAEPWSKLLASRNPDYDFWLWIPGTNISYPVVRNPVPGYYLNHTFSGKENPCGAIFCQEADAGETEDNIIVYGHNMKDGSMFADLKQYTDESFFRDHRDIWIYRQEKWQRYAIFSCQIVGDGDDGAYCRYFSDSNEKQVYLDRMKERALYPTEIQPKTADSLMTLSTCFGKRKRVIVQAVLLCYTE